MSIYIVRLFRKGKKCPRTQKLSPMDIVFGLRVAFGIGTASLALDIDFEEFTLRRSLLKRPVVANES